MQNLKPGWYWYSVPHFPETDKTIVRVYDSIDGLRIVQQIGTDKEHSLEDMYSDAIFDPVVLGSKEKWDALLDLAKVAAEPFIHSEEIKARLRDAIKAVEEA